MKTVPHILSALLSAALLAGLLAPELAHGQTSTNKAAAETKPQLIPTAEGSPAPQESAGGGLSITPSPTDTDEDRVARVVPATKPALDSPLTTVRPIRPEQNELTDQVKEQLARFEAQRDEFLEKQRILVEAYKKGTTEAERQKIRERFQDLRLRWIEVSKERRVEADLRQRALEARLKAHQELLQEAREQARDQALEQTRDRVRGRE
jgi:hypothetical protein